MVTLAATHDRFPRIEGGHGSPLVFLHGVFGTTDMFGDQIRAFSKHHRVISLELPFFDLRYKSCSIEGFAQYVIDFLDSAGIPSAIFVGNSLGGHVALHLATQAPDRVAGLVLAGSSGLWERSFSRVPKSPTREWLWDRIKEVFHAEEKIPPGTLKEVEDAISSRVGKFRLLKVAMAAKGSHMGGLLNTIKAPTLLVWGKQDRITPLEVAEEFNSGIPNSELVLVDECGHAPMIEQPHVFTEAVGAFLERLRKGAHLQRRALGAV